MKPSRNVRWGVAVLLCLATALNYLDRQTLSVLATTIQREMGLSTVEYARITSAFLISYTIMYAVSGRLIDAIGTRKGLLLFVSAWSVANIIHGFARTTGQLRAFRFLLGATEAGNFPGCVKAVSEWFPVRERALAIGFVNAGVAVGSAVAVPLVSGVAVAWGWRAAFIVTGALGLVWVVVWARMFHTPADHPRLSVEERALIAEGNVTGAVEPKVPLVRLLGMRETWGCLLARMLTDPISYFFYFWTPKYLQEARGFTLEEVGAAGWIPFVAMAAGSIGSGAVPRFLVARGWRVDRARKLTMLVAALAIPVLCVMIPRAASAGSAVAIMAGLMFFHAAWGNMTLPAEVFPMRVVATVTGLGGALGGLAGATSQLAIGDVVQRFGYAPVFGACAAAYLAAMTVVLVLLPRLGQIRRL